jgi:hypothetical protein
MKEKNHGKQHIAFHGTYFIIVLRIRLSMGASSLHSFDDDVEEALSSEGLDGRVISYNFEEGGVDDA